MKLNGIAPIGDAALLIYGESRTILRYDIAEGRLSKLHAPNSAGVSFKGHAEAGPGALLIYGMSGTILHYDISKGSLSDVLHPETDNVMFERHAEAGPGAPLIYGDEGTILRYDAEAGTLARQPVPDGLKGSTFSWDRRIGHSETLIASYYELVMVSDRLTSAARALTDLTDARMQEFLDTVLPRHLQDSDAIRPLRQRLSDIIGQRKVAVASREEAERNLANLWTGFFPLQAQRIAFRDFMADCRGPQDPLPTPEVAQQTTLACAAAWQAKLKAEEGSVWQTLSEKVPPGVLLLFLLGTLSGLYRYNLRLAGFHDSRADSLELLSLGRDEDEVRAAFDSSKTDVLNRIAAAMAADKVAFSSARDPTDQAVDLAKGILTRQ